MDNETFKIHNYQIRGSKSGQKVAPGVAKSAEWRTKRNPGKTGPFESANCQSRHRQDVKNQKKRRPIVPDNEISRCGLANACKREIQRQNIALFPFHGWSIQEAVSFCRGGNEALTTIIDMQPPGSASSSFANAQEDSLHPGLPSSGPSGRKRGYNGFEQEQKPTAFKLQSKRDKKA